MYMAEWIEILTELKLRKENYSTHYREVAKATVVIQKSGKSR